MSRTSQEQKLKLSVPDRCSTSLRGVIINYSSRLSSSERNKMEQYNLIAVRKASDDSDSDPAHHQSYVMDEVPSTIPMSDLQSDSCPSRSISLRITWESIITSAVGIHRSHAKELPTELDGPCMTKVCTVIIVTRKVTPSHNASCVLSK